MHKKITLFIAICLLAMAAVFADAPKREVRAVWLTTAWALDWPTVRVPAPVFAPDGVTITNETARQNARNQQQAQLMTILNRLYDADFNTIYFQVRAMADAFYRSSFEPWSHWISSERGADPGWSPLGWLIEEAHARGMEVHAWLNPYRYSSSTATFFDSHPLDHAVSNPEWLMDYTGIGNHNAGSKILNPGIPAVRNLIADIVEELITNYNLDGIVFDDYFYNTGTTNEMDQAQFDAYNPHGLSRGDWRRENINQMIADVQERILNVAPWVQFGVSPAGVAMGSNLPPNIRNEHGVRQSYGIDWQYQDIFSDPAMWLRRGIVDYVAPQIFWTHNQSPSPYACLSGWWSEVSNQFGRHFFSTNTATIGGISNADIPDELVAQVQTNRNENLNGVPGFTLFRDGSAHQHGVYTALRNNVFQHPALPANFGWKQAPIQGLVQNLNVSGQNLTWTYISTDARVFPSPFNGVRYAVYAVPNANVGAPDIFTSSRYLIGISYTTNFTLPAGVNPATHKIAVAVFDRFGNLFSPRTVGGTLTTVAPAQLTFPANNQANMALPALFTWEDNGAHKYIWQLAEDMAFTRPIASRETNTPSFNSALQTNLRLNTTYYWRVLSVKADAEVSVSEVRAFNATRVADELERKLAEANALIEKLKKENTALRNDTTALASANRDLQAQLIKAENTISDLETKLADAENTINDLEASLNTANNTISALESDNANLQSQLNTANSTISTLQVDLANANSTIYALEYDNANLQSQLNTANSTISSLQADLINANSTISSLQTDLSTANNTIINLQGQLITANNTISALQSDLSTANNTISELLLQIALLEQELADCNNETSAGVPRITNVHLHPNPAQNFVYITADFRIERIEIFNSSGIRVFAEENPADRINLHGFIPGTYFVRIYGNGGMAVTQKLIVR